jgi:hypothetical protein
MAAQITIQRVESVSRDVSVNHFDELTDAAKDDFTYLVQNGVETAVEAEVDDELTEYDIIRFTDYYQLRPCSR